MPARCASSYRPALHAADDHNIGPLLAFAFLESSAPAVITIVMMPHGCKTKRSLNLSGKIPFR
jgi:hypothetical protein